MRRPGRKIKSKSPLETIKQTRRYHYKIFAWLIKFPVRVLKRPWAADAVVNDIVERIVNGSNSITQRIEHSDVFSGVFAKYCQQMESGAAIHAQGIKNLRGQKNRFASFSKPLGRTCIYLDAVISTANWIAVQRRGEEVAADASEFLDFLTEDTEQPSLKMF